MRLDELSIEEIEARDKAIMDEIKAKEEAEKEKAENTPPSEEEIANVEEEVSEELSEFNETPEDESEEEEVSEEEGEEEDENKEIVTKSKRTLTADDLDKKEPAKKSFNETYAEFKKRKAKYGGLTVQERRASYEGLSKEELVARMVDFDGTIPNKDRFIAKLQRENMKLQNAALAAQNEYLAKLNEYKQQSLSPKKETKQETFELNERQKAFVDEYSDRADPELLKALLKANAPEKQKGPSKEIKSLQEQINYDRMEKQEAKYRAEFNQALSNSFPQMNSFVKTNEFSDFRKLSFSHLNLSPEDMYVLEQYKIPENATVNEILNKATEKSMAEPVKVLLKHFKEVSGVSDKNQTISGQTPPIPPARTSTDVARKKAPNLSRAMAKLEKQYDRGEMNPAEYLEKRDKLEKLVLKLAR